MLLELFFLCHLTVTFGNPFHKYPYVFLLDIGNEELQTNSEQIRVSIPGGSLALRYPAIGEGDSIAHVRVSGIDFGTDLKATIVDGGPGYKYVVIVFMGNPGAAYDAVVTVSTLINEKNTDDANTDSEGTEVVKSSDQVIDDNESQEESNDSAEIDEQNSDASDEPVPSASNFYDSAENEEVNGREVVSDKDDSLHVEENNNKKYEQNEEVDDYADKGDQENQDYDSDGSESDKSKVNDAHDSYQRNLVEINRNFYDKYYAIRPRLYDRVQDYPQEVNDADNEVENEDEAYSPKDPAELDQMFNDEEVHNEGEKYTDSNNNYSDADDSVAVAY